MFSDPITYYHTKKKPSEEKAKKINARLTKKAPGYIYIFYDPHENHNRLFKIG